MSQDHDDPGRYRAVLDYIELTLLTGPTEYDFSTEDGNRTNSEMYLF
jgi:hypothetical protein